MFELRDHTVVMSGASGALGSAIARRLLAAGARIAALERRPEALERALTGAGLEPVGGDQLTIHHVDFADQASVDRAIATTVARWGVLDHTFNATGAWAGSPTVETSDAVWSSLWDANFRPVLATCRAVVPVMQRQRSGTIVNVGARAALEAGAEVAAYAVAKAAVLRLTESLAEEFKHDGVRVNCVLPGTIDTPANRAAMPDADFTSWVSVDALVDAMLFLSSPAAAAIHGVALPVYGTG